MAVSVFFLIQGVAISTWVARIPDVKERLRLTDGTLGVALLVAAAGTVIGLTIVRRMVDRLGSRTVCRPASVAVAVTLIGPGVAPDLPVLMLALLVFGLSGGICNVAMNTQAVEVDRAYGRPVITSFHAIYSTGGLAGSALGIAAVHEHLSPALDFTVTGILLTLAGLACGRHLLRTARRLPPQPVRRRRPVRQPVIRPWPAARLASTRRALGCRVRGWRNAGAGKILALGGCCFACLLAEGAIADWSAVYLRDNLRIQASLAPSGFLVFSVAMAGGRIVGDRLSARLGSMRLAGISALVAGTGLAAGLVSQRWVAALAGLGIFGLGLAPILPQLFRVAGQQFPSSTGRAVASLATLGYVGLLSGPAVISVIASAVGLPIALGLLVVLMLTVAVIARGVRTWTADDESFIPGERIVS
jgi:MFS family permease